MRRIMTFASCLALALAVTSTAKADIESDFWSNVLNTVNPETGVNFEVGETIRLVFVTSGVVSGDDLQEANWNHLFDAPIGDMDAYYQAFADSSAAGGALTSTQSFSGVTWNPLTNTVTNSNSVSGKVASTVGGTLGGLSVFNSRGQLVADEGNDMLGSGVSLQNLIAFDESGTNQIPNSSVVVWTGSDVNGFGAEESGGSSIDARLNANVDEGHTLAAIGNGGATDEAWLSAALSDKRTIDGVGGFFPVNRAIYVMSDELTVVPEPSTILLWLGVSGMAGMVYWRKRRSS